MKRLVLLSFLLLPLATIPAGFSSITSEFAYIQLIHNIPTSGQIDLYVDGELFWDDASYQTATGFLLIAAGEHRIDVVAAEAADASAPLWTSTFTVRNRVNCIAVFGGGDGTEPFTMLMNETVRMEAHPEQAEFFLVYSSTDIGKIDLRLLDNTTNQPATILANNIEFGHVSGYIGLPPIGHNFEISSADNDKQYEVYWVNMSSYSGRTFAFLISGSGPSASEGLTLIGFDIDGLPLRTSVITAAESEPGLPDGFTLHGAYPNPFNPSTTLAMDLPAAASVSVAVFDVAGRQVLALPTRRLEAGAQTVRLEAGHLASGLYLYWVTARTGAHTQVRAGQMTLLR